MHFQSIYLPPYEFRSLKIKLYLIDFPKVATEQNYCKSKILSTTFYSFHYCNRFENMVWNWNSKLLFPKGPSKGTNSFWKVYIAGNVPWFITFWNKLIIKYKLPIWNPDFRLLEEAIEKGTWLICTGIENRSECENILDFMIRRLKTSQNINDNFRFWIICQNMKALTLTTAQKCCSHYLGHEVIFDVSST